MTYGVTNANKKVTTGQGLGGKTTIVAVGVGGGAISQAQLDGIIQGITEGASLQTGALQTDAFTVAAVGPFTPASSVSVTLALQGTGTPSTVTGDYYAAATLASTVVFA